MWNGKKSNDEEMTLHICMEYLAKETNNTKKN